MIILILWIEIPAHCVDFERSAASNSDSPRKIEPGQLRTTPQPPRRAVGERSRRHPGKHRELWVLPEKLVQRHLASLLVSAPPGASGAWHRVLSLFRRGIGILHRQALKVTDFGRYFETKTIHTVYCEARREIIKMCKVCPVWSGSYSA